MTTRHECFQVVLLHVSDVGDNCRKTPCSSPITLQGAAKHSSIGGSRASQDDYVEGPPELAGEVAGSSVSYDLHEKLAAYQRHGIQEYVVWRIYEQRLDWFQLVDGQYAAIAPDPDDILRSRVFPGLWLDVESLLAGDLAQVLDVLQRGLKTAEHAAFVQRLQDAHSSQK